jgi:hypothetical protein
MLWRLLIGDVVGAAAVTTTMLQGIALRYGTFMDSPFWQTGTAERFLRLWLLA